MYKFLKFMLPALVLCLAWSGLGTAEMPKQPDGRVSDFAQTLTPETKTAILQLSHDLEKSHGAQLAVVTVPALEGLTVEEYANKLFNLWGVGHKGKDDGILFLIAPSERKVRIEVGYGLEGTINDGKAGRILDESVIPYFKAGDYNQGILSGSQHIAAAITGDPGKVTVAAPPLFTAPEAANAGWKEKTFIILFFALFVTLGFLALGMGLRGNKFFILWGAGFGGIPLAMSVAFGYAFKFSIYILPLWALVVFLVGLIFGKKLNKAMAASGGKGGGRGGWSSGSSSGGGFSSSSSSGSSFGGGSSGGGGSSRSW
jgi:uncharacterized protein